MIRALFRFSLMGFFASAVLAAFVLIYANYYYVASGPLSEPKTLLFKRGTGFVEIVDQMNQEGVIRDPLLFKAIAVAVGSARKFKAGEYAFSPGITPKLVMDMIAEGRVVVHKVTIPEGITVAQTVEILNAEQLLEGELNPRAIEEGTLLPQTYHFTYGDERRLLIDRMRNSMRQTMAELWEKRAPNLPFTTQEEALILASIVEKETGVPHERGRVASVFINRLRMGMKLQTDPTVVYGIEKERGPMNRQLLLSDLRAPSAYNTYLIDGLPPTPICNPGRLSIEAVLNPLETKDLYFVATGNGGHNFASTLAQHNENVKNYRQRVREYRAQQAPKAP